MTLSLLPLQLPQSALRPHLVIAGPCAAETEEQVMDVARALAADGCRIFRAGVWKPRTKPGTFEGKGTIALPWLQRVKEETGMLLATEVATPEHVEQCLRHGIDLLWVGARTSANPFAMQALADALRGTDIPVLVKNPVNPDIELWMGALERLDQAGVRRLGAIHRGFCSYGEKLYRNTPMWPIPIELRRRCPSMPILCDPSHIGGNRALIAPLSQQAMDLRFDGLVVECHCHPDEAWSDARQQITPDSLHQVLASLVVRNPKGQEGDQLQHLRGDIDEIDRQLVDLLGQRMSVCREMGRYKKERGITVLQADRYKSLLRERMEEAKRCGLSPDAVARFFELIHEESIRQQLAIVNGDPLA